MSLNDQLINSEILQFYGWWQFATCFFAFMALMAIWWHLGKRKKDYSQIWLALSILCWSLTGLIEIVYARHFKDVILKYLENKGSEDLIANFLPEETLNSLSFQLEGFSSILSLSNSFLILMALPWFRHIPKRIKAIVTSKYWVYIIGLPFLFSLFPTVSKIAMSKNYGMISELDVYYSILTLIFLGWVLWESFDKRRLKLLAWLSLLCILITFLAQILKITGNEIDMRIYSAIFKSALIMIFFALALSWVKDLASNILPSANEIYLRLSSLQKENYKYHRTLTISGIPGKDIVEVSLTQAPYELMKCFFEYKRNDDAWLEIKPKGSSRQAIFPIKDYNEIKRLLNAILDGIYGKGNWTKEKHESTLKETLFEMPEKRERKIRLRIPASNLSS